MNSLKFVFVLFGWDYILSVSPHVDGGACIWNKDTDFPNYEPLIYDVVGQKTVLPTLENEQRIVRLSQDAEVILACPESTLTSLGEPSVNAKCVGATSLLIDGKEYDLKELGCTTRAKEEVTKRTTMARCGRENTGVVHTIGFKINEDIFYDLVEICFDHLYEIALYTKHTLRGENLGASDTGVRPGFKVDYGLYTVRVSGYDKKNQENLMNELLGKNVIDSSASLYLARGHLAPDGDFVLHEEAEATYYYINAIPQWQSINNGNWKSVEYSIRNLAKDHGSDLTIFTGSSEVLTLKDENNNNVPIFLGLSDEDDPKSVIPVPRTTWKVVCEASTNKGVGFATINDPFLESEPESICTDVCQDLQWLSAMDSEVTKGKTFCCTVEELRQRIPEVPFIGCEKLLDI